MAGVGVAVGLGVYGRFHDPSGVPSIGGLQDGKVWLATAVLLFAVVQLVSATTMNTTTMNTTTMNARTWTATIHRWSGRLAVLLSLPIAVHCLYALGFNTTSLRTLAHSTLGCLFYGAFVTKMLVLSRPGETRSWLLPLLGGLALTAMTGLWLTSALWFFTS